MKLQRNQKKWKKDGQQRKIVQAVQWVCRWYSHSCRCTTSFDSLQFKHIAGESPHWWKSASDIKLPHLGSPRCGTYAHTHTHYKLRVLREKKKWKHGDIYTSIKRMGAGMCSSSYIPYCTWTDIVTYTHTIIQLGSKTVTVRSLLFISLRGLCLDRWEVKRKKIWGEFFFF